MTFLEYEWGTRWRCNSQIVDRCTESCLACRQTHTNYFETGAILSSWWLIEPNASKASIVVILVGKVKAKFSTTGSSKKVSTDKCGIDKQPEIAIWLLKPEILIPHLHDVVSSTSWLDELAWRASSTSPRQASSSSWLDKRFTMKPASWMLHECFMKLAREASFT